MSLLVWKYFVFSLLIRARQSCADLEKSGRRSFMSWQIRLKISRGFSWACSPTVPVLAGHPKLINRTVSSWGHASPLLFSIVEQMLIETRVIYRQTCATSVSFYKDRSRSILVFTLEERSIKKRLIFLKLPLEVDFLSPILSVYTCPRSIFLEPISPKIDLN